MGIIPFSELRRCKDMHTIQVAKDWNWCTKKSPIQYGQHSSFNMNCKFVLEDLKETNNIDFIKFKLIALQNLAPGTLVKVSYNSFEWEITCCFVDAEAPSEYGSGQKGREVRGYKFAKPDERKLLK